MHRLLLGGMYMHVLLSVEPPGIGSIHVCFRLSDIVYRACIHVQLKNFWGKKMWLQLVMRSTRCLKHQPMWLCTQRDHSSIIFHYLAAAIKIQSATHSTPFSMYVILSPQCIYLSQLIHLLGLQNFHSHVWAGWIHPVDNWSSYCHRIVEV